MKEKELTGRIINAFYKVYNSLHYGHAEKIYENALLHELRKRGLKCEQQKMISVYYDGLKVGYYITDICVEDLVILELKASQRMEIAHEAQLFGYLKASEYELGLVLNFGLKPEMKRKAYSNSHNSRLES